MDGRALEIKDNKILGVALSQKGSRISVKFFDNIKHAIKLTVEDESN